MAIFGRSFPSKSHPFGAISAPTPTSDVTDTLTNIGVASYTLTSAEAQAVSQSGNSTQSFALDATAETDSTSEAGSQIITNITGDTTNNSGSGSSTTTEATAETTNNSATASQTLSESIVTPSVEDTLTNTGTSSQSLVEKIAESPLGSETYTVVGPSTYKETDGNNDGSGWLQDAEIDWPPNGTDWHASDNSAILYAAHGKAATYSYSNNIFFRWNTSSLSNVIVTDAKLRIYIYGVGSNDSSTLLVGDYYDFGGAPSTLADYKYYTVGDPSIFTPIGPINPTNFPGSSFKEINLTNLSGINKNGYTGIRLGITSNEPFPSTDWALQVQSIDSGAFAAAELVLTYQTIGNAQNIPIITSLEAEIVSNVGGPGAYGEGGYGEGDYGYPAQTIIEKIAETVSNSATATITIDEIISVPSESIVNTGTATLRINEAESQSPSHSGTGTQNLFEVIAESVTNQGTATTRLGVDATAEAESNFATALHRITEYQSESEDNTGTGTGTLVEKLAETVSNSAASSQTIDEVVQQPGDALDNIGVAALRITETEAASETGSGSGSQNLSEKIAETDSNTGTGTQTFTEAIAEGANNTGTGSQNITEQSPEINLTSVALSTQSLAEAITETTTSVATSTQTFGEAFSDSLNNSATNSQTIADLEADNPINTGTGSHSYSEAIAEMDTVTFLASQTIDDQRTITVVPFSDISTGTWTVAPLYEKVDELIVASGYPTETIRSGNNPSNDTAVMGLTPVSDPGIDNNHFINVEFYKDGSEVLDFIVKFKEGNTVIATRTFTDVLATESAPRRERIALTNGETSAIVDYSNLNVEITANQTS